jgi:hypothetical protein
LTQLTAAEEKLGEPPDVEHDFWALFALRTVGLMNITVDEEKATEYIVDRMLQDTDSNFFLRIVDMRSFFKDGTTLLTRELMKRLVHHYLQKYKYVEGGDNSWLYAIDYDREKSKPMTIYDYAYYADGWFATYDFLLMQVMCSVFFCMDVGVILVMFVAFVTKMATAAVLAIVLYQFSKRNESHESKSLADRLRVLICRGTFAALCMNISFVSLLAWVMPLGYSKILAITGMSLAASMIRISFIIARTGKRGKDFMLLLLLHVVLYTFIPAWNIMTGHGKNTQNESA